MKVIPAALYCVMLDLCKSNAEKDWSTRIFEMGQVAFVMEADVRNVRILNKGLFVSQNISIWEVNACFQK